MYTSRSVALAALTVAVLQMALAKKYKPGSPYIVLDFAVGQLRKTRHLPDVVELGLQKVDVVDRRRHFGTIKRGPMAW